MSLLWLQGTTRHSFVAHPAVPSFSGRWVFTYFHHAISGILQLEFVYIKISLKIITRWLFVMILIFRYCIQVNLESTGAAYANRSPVQ